LSTPLRWYVVLAPWWTRPARRHLGLGGEAWPLDLGEPEEAETALVWVAGCSYEVCLALTHATAYLDVARASVPALYLVEVRHLDDDGDGIDLGRPSGGFSAAGELCSRPELDERYGRFLNDQGLFASPAALQGYLAARAGRETIDRLEYLDESLPLSVRVLAVMEP
jgi:hypothetical protein